MKEQQKELNREIKTSTPRMKNPPKPPNNTGNILRGIIDKLTELASKNNNDNYRIAIRDAQEILQSHRRSYYVNPNLLK